MNKYSKISLVLLIMLLVASHVPSVTLAEDEWPQCEPWGDIQDGSHPGDCYGSWCDWYNPFSGPATHVKMIMRDVCYEEDGSYYFEDVGTYMLKTNHCC